jgi:ribulose-5-phosphate 4-epimerase/fuculose-1-phosphate aldolase
VNEPAALELAGSARARLQQRHLLTRGLFSVRVPGREAMAVLDPEGEPRILGFAEALDPRAALHAQVYRRRGDAGAVLSACPPWAATLAGLARPLPVVFDEQARHLGPVLPLTGPQALDSNGTAYFLPDGCLCIGTTRDRAVFNAELLEKCSQAFLLAFLARGRVWRIPLPIRLFAWSRLRRDQRIAAAAIAQGRFAQTATAY